MFEKLREKNTYSLFVKTIGIKLEPPKTTMNMPNEHIPANLLLTYYFRFFFLITTFEKKSLTRDCVCDTAGVFCPLWLASS
jgi:hypothetical protein